MRHLGGAHRLGGVHQQLCHVQRLVRGVAAGRGCPAVCAVCRTRPPVAGVQEHRPPLGVAAGGAGPTRDACKGSRPGRQQVDGELRLCPVPATVQWLPRPAAVAPPLPPAWVPTLQAVLSMGRRLWVALLGGLEAARLVRVSLGCLGAEVVESPLFEGPATGAPSGHAHPAGLQGTLPNRAARHSKTHRCGLRRHTGGSPASGSCLQHLCTPRAAPGRPPRRRAAMLNTRLHGWDRSAAARGWRARRGRLGTRPRVRAFNGVRPQKRPPPRRVFLHARWVHVPWAEGGGVWAAHRAGWEPRHTTPVGVRGRLGSDVRTSNKISPLAVPRVARQPRARETHARPAPAVRSAGERRACAAAGPNPTLQPHRRFTATYCPASPPPARRLPPACTPWQPPPPWAGRGAWGTPGSRLMLKHFSAARPPPPPPTARPCTPAPPPSGGGTPQVQVVAEVEEQVAAGAAGVGRRGG